MKPRYAKSSHHLGQRLDTSLRRRLTTGSCYLYLLLLASPLFAGEAGKDQVNADEHSPATARLESTEDTNPAFTWNQLAKGSAQLTLSGSLKDEKQFRASAYVPVLMPDGKSAEVAVIVSPVPMRLGSFKLTRIALQLQDKNILPSPGTYIGLLNFQIAGENDVTPIRIKITVPGPRPGVDKIFVVSKRSSPWSHPWSQTFTVPLVSTVDATSVSEEKPATVGFAHRDPNGWLPLKWVGTSRDGTTAAATIRIEGLSAAGRYEGSINLSGAENSDSQTTLTLVAKDSVLWPILTILAGVLIAWAAKWYLGVGRVFLGLSKEEKQLTDLLASVTQSFKAIAQTSTVAAYGVDRDVSQKRKDIRDNLRAMIRTVASSVDANHNYKRVVDLLSELYAHLPRFPQVAIASGKLQAEISQAGALSQTNLFIPQGTTTQSPALLASARTLLQGKALLTDQIEPLIKAMTDNTVLLKAWCSALEHVRSTSKLYIELSSLTALTPPDKETLKSAERDLTTVWIRLWNASTTDEVAAISAAGSNLESADISLDMIRARASKGSGLVAKGPRVLIFAEHRRQLLAVLDEIARPQSSDPEHDRQEARHLGNFIRLGDIASVLLALVIAVVTGLTSNYFGQAFGSIQDYAVLFLWAAGTKVGLDLVTAVTDRLLSFS